ncbi:hypothetical protein D3C72_1348180 [compost metagenome]
MAHLRAAGLDLAAHAHAGHPAARTAPGRGAAVAALAPDGAGHAPGVLHRAQRRLVVDDGRRRHQRRAPAGTGRGTAGLEGRRAATCYRPAGPPGAWRLGHHHCQRVGHAGGDALCAGVREDAGGGQHARLREQRRRCRAQLRLGARATHGRRGAGQCRPAVAGRRRRRHAAGRAGRRGPSVGDGTGAGRGAGHRAAGRRLPHQAHRDAAGAGRVRQVVARRRVPRQARDRCAGRHDLGGGQRSGACRRHHPRQRPGP